MVTSLSLFLSLLLSLLLFNNTKISFFFDNSSQEPHLQDSIRTLTKDDTEETKEESNQQATSESPKIQHNTHFSNAFHGITVGREVVGQRIPLEESIPSLVLDEGWCQTLSLFF